MKETPPFWPVALLLVAASILYSLPLFDNLDWGGRRDWDQFTFRYETPRVALLRDHTLPAWNPYANGGNALIAHPDSPFPSPWYLIVLALGAPLGLRVQVAVFTALGAVGMAALTRRLGASPAGSVAGAIVFMMSAHFSLHIAEGHLEWCVLGLMPWLAWCLLRGEQDSRFVIVSALLLASVVTFGAVYIPAVFLPFFSFWMLFRVMQSGVWKPLVRWGVVVALAGLLSSVKLIPTIHFASVGEREVMADQRTPARLMLVAMLDPRQALLYQAHRDHELPDGHFAKSVPNEVAEPIVERLTRLGTGELRFHEFGFYVGAVGLLLAGLGILGRWLRLWPLYAAGAVALVVGLGASSPLDLWLAIRQLPLYERLQVPSRFFAAVVFVLGVAAAMGLGTLLERVREGPIHLRRSIAVALPLMLFGELAILGWGLFRDVFVLPPLVVVPQAEFAQRYTERIASGTPEGAYALVTESNMVDHMLSNSGTLDAYENLTVPRGEVRTVGEPAYRGELYLEAGRGSVDIDSWTMSRVEARLALTTPDRLVLNQNYAEGWRVRLQDAGGRETVLPAVGGPGGLVSVPVAPEHVTAEFYYVPPGLAVGAWLSGIAGLLCIGWLALERRRGNRPVAVET
jgi:hypothetical protein